ncbi:hypothetical protein EYF80_060965 [Liparis tanakae]|uniref:WW domain-containing protein n=1 Tax=Liparis tanakae TaxID=230148 RepID=A0A4Z2EJ43_9TELE|nr:hypothetical protein EYF80_060965 [Liparis tanakae]
MCSGEIDKKPAAVSSAVPTEETDGRPLPPGWRSYTSPEGVRYYVNGCSKGERRSQHYHVSPQGAAEPTLPR